MPSQTTASTAPRAARPARRGGTLNARSADLARIHALAKQLQLDDGAYRDLMATVCGGVRSAALLDISGRRRFIEHLQRCVQGSAPAAARPQRTIERALTPDERKLWALWMALADAGAVHQRSMRALSAYVERALGVSRVEWLTTEQMQQAIEQLKQWLRRLERQARQEQAP